MAIKNTGFAASYRGFVGRLFAAIPLSPTQITLLSLLPAAAGLYFAYEHRPLVSLLSFFLAGILDTIDGAVARSRGQVSARGAYIDGMVDRLVEFLFILSLFLYPLPPFILPAGLSLILILFFGSTMSAFAIAYADHRKVASLGETGRAPGILPRAERYMLLFAALLFVPFFPASSSFILLCCALLSFVTFCQRFWYFGK
jgi:phosphatidylglycerophosphate synthase